MHGNLFTVLLSGYKSLKQFLGVFFCSTLCIFSNAHNINAEIRSHYFLSTAKFRTLSSSFNGSPFKGNNSVLIYALTAKFRLHYFTSQAQICTPSKLITTAKICFNQLHFNS